ncbi:MULTISPECIES: hypothetical protein [Pseudomonas]|uniref:hypothetical protein n=1 Tax=Pseudomonas TaxID=286 RepID=UPI000FC417DF|nr:MULTISPECIES: hypothetical protein [Pseudomonas]RUE17070.1 hypothetical protein IPC1222_25500 [Pseudomonas aeruginosa]
MIIKDTPVKQALVFFVLIITLAASASLATVLFMKHDVGFWYQILGYSAILSYYTILLISLCLIDIKQEEPEQLEFDFSITS